MKLAHRAGVALLITQSWLACTDEAPPPEPEAPVAAATPTPPTPMLPPRTAEDEVPSAQALPIVDDFEEAAAEEITAETYLAKLGELEAELAEAEQAE